MQVTVVARLSNTREGTRRERGQGGRTGRTGANPKKKATSKMLLGAGGSIWTEVTVIAFSHPPVCLAAAPL